MRDSNPFASFALAERCTDELCQRSSSTYPSLPISPPFDDGLLNPCIREGGDGRVQCIPAVHVTGSWHSFVDEGLVSLLGAHPRIKRDSGAWSGRKAVVGTVPPPDRMRDTP